VEARKRLLLLRRGEGAQKIIPELSTATAQFYTGAKAENAPGMGEMRTVAKVLRNGQRLAPLWLAMTLLLSSLAGRALPQAELPPSIEPEIARGVQALKAGDLDAAQQIFGEVLGRGVKHPLVFHNLGVIAQRRGNHQQAITRFRQALSLEPSYGPSHLLLGSSLLELGRNREAVGELRRSVGLMPSEPTARLMLARAYEASDQWLPAVEVLQKLAALRPQDVEASYQLGKALTKLSGWSLAQIARENPDSARLHQALGQEYVIQEKYDQALNAYREAARSDPKLPEIHLGMAVILLQMKRLDEALAEIELELKLVPESRAAAETKVKIEAARGSSTP
jgi:tetratricopeptide (TPR) repeat protein